MNPESELSGAVIRDERGIWFVPSPTAHCVHPRARVTDVPGSKLKIALVRDEVMSVLQLGSSRRGEFLECHLAQGKLVLADIEVLATGRFALDGEGCVFEGHRVPSFDFRLALSGAGEA